MTLERASFSCLLLALACRAPEVETQDGDPGAGAARAAPASAGRGGAGSGGNPRDPAPVEAGSGGSDPGAAGGGASGVDPACAAPAARVPELLGGFVRPGARVGLDALVAVSSKFLLYRSKSEGTCLWGVYAAEPDVARHHGILLVAYGAPAPSADAPCSLGSDAIPDGIASGDVVSAQGEVESFVPSACEAIAPSVQLRLDSRCPLTVTGAAEEIAALPLDVDRANAVAAGDARAIAEFAGALVELEAVRARPVPGETDAVAPFGVIRLEETALEIHDALAFMDLRGEGPGDASKSLRFGYPTEFLRVRGIVHLDYCTWALAPRDECADLSPPSAGCAPGPGG